ncbi:serine/threonine-protein kinase PCRK1-like [Rutidosis leptorrhynchoides]|uniref:serine/threonine-protein kinase PCRK1-like n=1 Tax=Rutidosis leptorrhynchoides TaxID=125765 RepID=UPI003A99E568
MMCFQFSCFDDKGEEPISPTQVSTIHSLNSGSTDFNASGSESNDHSVPDPTTKFKKSKHPSFSKMPSHLREFKFSELKAATKNFSLTSKLGEGGFGSVYIGTIKNPRYSNKDFSVAVKQLGKRGFQGHKEWVAEVNVLGISQHPNLVTLIGYCAEDHENGIQRLLVYEYMANRCVEYHLSSRSGTVLSWSTRLKIAQDTARGLAYLHEGMGFQIIFRDFKSSNILLDDQWNAKLSDFGLARLGPKEGYSHVTTAVVGTMGYAAPEYIQTGRLTSKNDVWSYGVFLYELITGRRPLDRNRPKGEHDLLEWVRPYLDDKNFPSIVDNRLEGKYSLRSALRLSLIANKCLSRDPKSRPTMSEVLEMVSKLVAAQSETTTPKSPLQAEGENKTAFESIRNEGKTMIDPTLEDSAWFSGTWFWKPSLTC